MYEGLTTGESSDVPLKDIQIDYSEACDWLGLLGEFILLRVDLASSSREKIDAISMKASILEVRESASIIFRRTGRMVASISDMFVELRSLFLLLLSGLFGELDEEAVGLVEEILFCGIDLLGGDVGAYCLA